ncbi:MAG: glycosyltransferase family 9 protein [Nitrospirae bacterium]|nr:glycosyltransferase family 9 protein [Nitrospirota bacterium]
MNVLVVRPDGIGDVVLSLPVASQLRRLIPHVRIGFLTSPVVAPILDRHPDVDYVRTIRWVDPLRDLQAAFSGVDTAVFLKPFRRLMWAAFLARVPIRVATGFRWYSLLANRRIYDHRSEFLKHESEYNVEMLKGLGLNPLAVTRPRVTLSDIERNAGERRWTGLPSPRVVIHPGGFSARRWRLERYLDLTIELAREGYGVALTGSDEERVEFEREMLSDATLPPGISNLMGRLSVRELMAVIANAHVVVSGATGPAHLAAALGIATVSLFDPRRNNLPVRWKPLGVGVLLRPDVPTCEKCIGEACPYWDCLDRFSVHQVASHIAQVAKIPSALTVLHI